MIDIDLRISFFPFLLGKEEPGQLLHFQAVGQYADPIFIVGYRRIIVFQDGIVEDIDDDEDVEDDEAEAIGILKPFLKDKEEEYPAHKYELEEMDDVVLPDADKTPFRVRKQEEEGRKSQ